MAAGAVSDSVGNASEAASTLSVSVDDTPPSVVNLSSPPTGRSATWTWGCSESPCTYKFVIRTSRVAEGTSPFIYGDLFGANSSATQRSGNGTYWIYVQARDAAGNLSSLVLGSATLDNRAPTVTVARANGETGAVSGAFNVTITFSESVSDFALADIFVARGSASALTGSGASYGATITPDSGETSVRVSVAADVAADGAGNNNTASGNLDVTVAAGDTTPPTISGLSDDTTVRRSKSWSWGCNETCTYRYAVNQSSSHTFANSAAYGTTTTATQSTGNGTYYLHVQAKDAADNASSVVSVSAVLDNTNPSVTGLTDDSVATSSKQWTWGCSESSCTYRHAINQSASHTFSNEAYSSATTATQSTGNGTYYLHVQAKDAANNESSVVSVSAVLSQGAFGVTGISPDSTPTPSKTWNWGCGGGGTCTYRHVINTEETHVFDTGDSYGSTTTATKDTGDGTYYLHVQARGSDNRETEVTSVSVILDNTAPTVALSRLSGETSSAVGGFDVIITLSESVASFAATDITVQNGAVSTLLGPAPVYRAFIVPDVGATEVTVSVAASAVRDLAGLSNGASNSLSVSIDGGMILSLKTRSPGRSLTPEVSMEGGASGSVFKVYGDQACSDELATGTMPTSGTASKTVTLSTLKRNKLYRFYYKTAANSAGLTSADCTPSMARYTALSSYSTVVSAGHSHSCAITDSGGVMCWGSGGDGQLGNDGTTGSELAVNVVSADGETTLLDDIIQIEVGGDDADPSSDGSFSCALTSRRGRSSVGVKWRIHSDGTRSVNECGIRPRGCPQIDRH